MQAYWDRVNGGKVIMQSFLFLQFLHIDGSFKKILLLGSIRGQWKHAETTTGHVDCLHLSFCLKNTRMSNGT